LRDKLEKYQLEKQALEEALRDETLANEEQRNYIEILRNAIDQKMESLGIGEILSRKNLAQGQDPVTAYMVISELKKESEAWKKESKSLEERIKL